MSILDLYIISSWTTTVTYLLAVVVLIYKKSLFKIPYRYISIYLLVFCCLDIIFWTISWTDLINYFNRNTLFSFYLATINSTLLMMFFFKSYLSDLKKVIVYSGLGLFIFTIIEGLFISGFKHYNVYSSFFVYLWILVFTMLSIKHLILNRKRQSIRKEPLFLFFVGLLISTTANTVLSTTANALIDYSDSSFIIVACVVYLMNIVSNILYAIGFYEI